jgi:predicted SnoaL-like aldol condensation-catalyzing enzyme
MPTEENKAIIRRLVEVALNQGKLAIVDELFAADFVDRSTPDQPPGPAGVKAYIAQVRAGFPDLRVRIDDLIAEGDKVVIRTTWRGTRQPGEQRARTLIQIFRLADGKIAEEWNEGEGLL